jgi:hypothetical protein
MLAALGPSFDLPMTLLPIPHLNASLQFAASDEPSQVLDVGTARGRAEGARDEKAATARNRCGRRRPIFFTFRCRRGFDDWNAVCSSLRNVSRGKSS